MTIDDLEKKLTEIQQRCEKATSGPWKLLKVFNRYPDGTPSCDIQPAWDDRYELRIASACRLHEAEFLANAREDIPFLLTQLAAAQATITALSQENQSLKERVACTPETTKAEGASQPLRADQKEIV